MCVCACSGGSDHSPSVAAGKNPSERLPPSLFSFSLFLVSEYEVIGCCALAAQPADVCISVHMSTSERTRSARGILVQIGKPDENCFHESDGSVLLG